MLRKLSTKQMATEDKVRVKQTKLHDNEYYLSRPNIKTIKNTSKDNDNDICSDKIIEKYQRKISHHHLPNTLSLNMFKNQLQCPAKEFDNYHHDYENKNNAVKKVELRKVRSTSNGENCKKSTPKNGFKLQLATFKKQGGKRLTLKIETPTTKKGSEKLNLKNFHQNGCFERNLLKTETKSIKTLKFSQSITPLSSTEFQCIFTRCKKLIENYEQQMETIKKQNIQLREQNNKLKMKSMISQD